MCDIDSTEQNDNVSRERFFSMRSHSWLFKISLLLLMLDYIIDFRSLSTSFHYGDYTVLLGFDRSVQAAATIGLLCPEFNGGSKMCTAVCIISSLLSSDISIYN